MAATHKPQIGAHGVRLNRGLGITERIAPKMETWTGETRVRFTDFQVNEISKDGTVVHLKETKLVELPAKSAAATTSENPKSQDATEASGVAQAPQGAEEPRGNGTAPQGAEEPHGNGTRQNGAAPPDPPAPEIPEPAAADIQAITDLASAEFAESLVAIYQAAAAKKTIPPPARSPPLEDKEQRGQLHQLVRRVFHSLIDTTTDNSDPSLAGAIIVASGRPPRPSKAYNQANRMKTGNNRRSAKGKAVEAQEAAAGRKRKWEAEQAQAQEQTQEQEQGPEGKKAKVEGQDDVVMGEAAEAVGASADAGNGASAVTAEAAKTAVSDEEKTKVAVIVKFQLGKSAYATVALRELMGEEDAGEQQTQETSA
ncbi:hypothetical protein VdG2_07710 [Verticillium dahliae VDG2]|nr:hypothetical protein VdG2_07710 [Verticillium dahliae VDG2]